jgi:hypothetical protein
LLGWEADDERLANSRQILRDTGVSIRIETVDAGDLHPNTSRLTLAKGDAKCFLRAVSSGGGMIEVLNVADFKVCIFGDCFETLLWVRGSGPELARRLAAQVDASAVLAHEAAGACATLPGAVIAMAEEMGLGEVAMAKAFAVAMGARDAGIRLVREAMAAGRTLRGFEVDDVVSGHIQTCGYGSNLRHRTGHSISREVHGVGANMDNMETHDERPVIPWTCFSIEPALYLPECGVRTEINVFVEERSARVTGEMQTEFVRL